MVNDNKLWIALLGIAGSAAIAYYIYTTMRIQEEVIQLYTSTPEAYVGDSIELYGIFTRYGKPSVGETVYIYQTDKYGHILSDGIIKGPLSTDESGLFSTNVSLNEPCDAYFVAYELSQIPM